MTPTTQLSLLSEDELTRLEKKVREGLKAFVEVGNALLKIQQSSGYRLRGYKSFESYCEKEFGFTDRHGRRLIDAAKTAGSVHKAIGQAPANEAVARELKRVADDPIVLQKVQAKLEKKKTDIAHAPAEAVAEAVAAVTGKSRPEPKPAPNAALKLAMSKASGNGSAPEQYSVAHLVASDTCPQCRKVPDSYRHSPNGWQCGNCQQLVTLSVQAVIARTTAGPKLKTCNNCNAELQSGVALCFNCGEVAR